MAVAEEPFASGAIDDDIVSALNDTDPNVAEPSVTVVGPRPRALLAAAALAVGAFAWCAKGALPSLVPSDLQEMAHQVNSNDPPPDWVTSAILGCAGGPVLGTLTSQARRLKFAGAVLDTVTEPRRNYG